MEIWSIDRLEGDWAVCIGPSGQRQDVPRSQLPSGAKEGDCLRFSDGCWEADPGETARRREKAFRRTRNLLGKK